MSVFKDVKITKRDGRIVDFDPSKIENAIRKANNSVSSESQIPEYNIGNIASLAWHSVIILIVISILLTFISSLFPSRAAARKDPVIALRTE